MTYSYIAPAKINWALNITGRRVDGYHLLDMLMQTIVDLCPVATDMPAEKAVDDDDKAVEVAFDPNGTTAAIVFKTISDQYGKFSMVKVVRGKITGDMALYNTTTGNTEKLGRLYAIKGKKTEEVKEICCGDIAAIRHKS